MSVTATFEYDPDEFYRGLRVVSRRSTWHWLTLAFAALIALMVIYVVAVNWRTADPGELVLALLPWVILVVFWGSFLPLMHRSAAKKLIQRDASARGLQERTVDDFGYRSRGNDVVFEMPWHAMHDVIETPELFLFFYNKDTAYYIPKRVLSAGQISELRALISNHLRDRAKLLS